MNNQNNNDKRNKYRNSNKRGGKKNPYRGKPGNQGDNKNTKNAFTPPATNDFSWYNKYPSLTESVARLPFAQRPGMSVGIRSVENVVFSETGATPTITTTDVESESTIPTVLGIKWIPTIGNSVNNQSPASIAARELYGKVRSAFSGTLDENAPDLLMYVMALDSIFTYISWLKRVYRTLNSYSPYNKGVPYAILTAEGFTSSMITNLFEGRIRLWGVINNLIYNVSKFSCPDVMDIFKRHYWMSSNVYTDANSAKAQLYLFSLDGVYQYNGTGDQGTQLDFKSITFSGDTVDSMYTLGSRLIAALSESDDAYTMNGHILRAFESSPQFKIALLEENERLDFVYDPVVLMQINNSTCFYGTMSTQVASITQDVRTNAVIQQIKNPFPTTKNQPSHLLINVHAENPGVGDVVEATRLMGRWNADGSYECGTELVTYYRLITHEKDSDTWSYIMFDSSGEGNDVPEVWQFVSQISAFNDFPILYVVQPGETADSKVVYPICDVYNVCAISPQDLSNLHEVCVYSEFNSFGIS